MGSSPTVVGQKPSCDRAARVGEVANDNQRKKKCVQNIQEFNSQLVEKKYNKNTRKTIKTTIKGTKRERKGAMKRAIAPLQGGENSTKLCPTGLTSERGNWNCTNA